MRSESKLRQCSASSASKLSIRVSSRRLTRWPQVHARSGSRPAIGATWTPLREVTIDGMDDCALSPAAPPVGNTSGRTVHCVKFQKELPGLDAPPWPGELGQRIYENVSAQAWKLWEERQKMILNEYRLMPWQKEAQELIAQADGGLLLRRERGAAPGYVPQQTK